MATGLRIMLLTFALVGCSQHDKDYASRSIVRWSITNAITGVAIGSGCADFGHRLENAISFRATPGDDVWETQTWESVEKTADSIPGRTDVSFWCADQDGVDTRRSSRVLLGEGCVATQDVDPPAKITAVELVNPVTATAASGRRVRLGIVRPGALVLTMAQPCWSDALMETCDAFCPIPWTELTILP